MPPAGWFRPADGRGYNGPLAWGGDNGMQIVQNFVELVLHLERHLTEIVAQYGALTYAILFAIIFLETGVVIMPFLPGDSLLFAAGAVAALEGSGLNVYLLFILLAMAAVLGDGVNYWLGKKIGPRAFGGKVRFLKKEHLERTQRFYDKHGNKTIFLARFVPIVRTFAPFVAGVGEMEYRRFATYNVVGGVIWTGLFIAAGYLFGQVPAVKENFSLVIFAIIGLSLVPILYELIMSRRARGPAGAEG
jgi:membrane-associated protein